MTQPAVGQHPFRQFPRAIAGVALLAFAVGRSLTPALRGSRAGLDRIIPIVDVAGAFFTYLFAFVGMAATLQALGRTRRQTKLGAAYQWASVVCAVVIVLVLGPAFYRPVGLGANIAVAVASATLALLAARETLRVPLTRALGVLLVTAGCAAWFHVLASVLAWQAGERARYGLAVFARVLATFSAGFDVITLLVAFAWLATRPQKEGLWGARAAVFVGCVLAWAVAGATRDGAAFWQVLVQRVLSRQMSTPAPYVWEPLRYALEASAPLLALAALVVRQQVPAIVSAVALLLVARPVTDVPLSAVALGLSALLGALAARDERGIWAVLLRNERGASARDASEASERALTRDGPLPRPPLSSDT